MAAQAQLIPTPLPHPPPTAPQHPHPPHSPTQDQWSSQPVDPSDKAAGKREGWGELSLGSHLVPSCYFWGRALSPLLDGGKSMARRENMASSWNRREIVVAAVHSCLYPAVRLGTAFG